MSQPTVKQGLTTIKVAADQMYEHADHLNTGFYNNFADQYLPLLFKDSLALITTALPTVLGHVQSDKNLLDELRLLQSAGAAADREAEKLISAGGDARPLLKLLLNVLRAAPNVSKGMDARLLAMPGPQAPAPSAKSEGVLDVERYEHTLKVMQNMSLMLERSPGTFKHLGEEAIRDHFLVQLNGHYEGAATGETVNGAGKTDILVRVDNRNILIAECKFWDGPKSLSDAIDQLFTYTTWRDTKCAVLVFVRDTAISTVLAKAPEVLKQHPSFKHDVHMDGEGRLRSVFGQPNDPRIEVLVTTVIFHFK